MYQESFTKHIKISIKPVSMVGNLSHCIKDLIECNTEKGTTGILNLFPRHLFGRRWDFSSTKKGMWQGEAHFTQLSGVPVYISHHWNSLRLLPTSCSGSHTILRVLSFPSIRDRRWYSISYFHYPSFLLKDSSQLRCSCFLFEPSIPRTPPGDRA